MALLVSPLLQVNILAGYCCAVQPPTFDNIYMQYLQGQVFVQAKFVTLDG